MSTEKQKTKTYLWCGHCRRSYSHDEVRDGLCPVCGNELGEMGKFSAILRGLMATELVASDLRTKHRQLVRLIWTRNGMGEQYYRVLAPNLPYNKFEARVTELVCRGAEEGWVKIVIPDAPSSDESQYKIEFDDEERFVRELEEVSKKKP